MRLVSPENRQKLLLGRSPEKRFGFSLRGLSGQTREHFPGIPQPWALGGLWLLGTEERLVRKSHGRPHLSYASPTGAVGEVCSMQVVAWAPSRGGGQRVVGGWVSWHFPPSCLSRYASICEAPPVYPEDRIGISTPPPSSWPSLPQ